MCYKVSVFTYYLSRVYWKVPLSVVYHGFLYQPAVNQICAVLACCDIIVYLEIPHLLLINVHLIVLDYFSKDLS